MKFKLINTKKIIAFVLSGFVIVNMVGCSKTTSNLNSPYEQGNNTIIDESANISNNEDELIIQDSFPTENDNQENDEIYEENKTTENVNPTNNNELSNDEIYYSDDDITAIQTFNNINDEIDNTLNSENIENAKNKAKGTFITIVDFIFYDSEINGVTFDELTDNGKQKILEIANKIDLKIENKFPNYKDTISESAKKAFNKASELIKKGAYNLGEFSKEKLGEENYNAIINVKDEIINYTKEAIDIIGNVGSDLFDSGKEYIKNWYENFKNN